MGIYDQIFDKAYKMAKDNLNDSSLYKQLDTGVVDILSIDEFIENSQQMLADKGIDQNSEEFCAAYSAFKSLREVNNLCVAHELRESVDKIFQKENAWLKANGVTPDKQNAIEQYVFNKALGIDEKSPAQLKLIDTLDNLMKSSNGKSSDGRIRLIQDSFHYADGVINALSDGSNAYDAITKPKMANKFILNDDFKNTIQLATGTYAADTTPDKNNRDINSLAGSILGNYELEDKVEAIDIQYDVQNGISPRDFLNRCSNGTVTKEDKVWANQILNNMIGRVFDKDHKITVTDFMVGLTPIVSEEEFHNALGKSNEAGDPADLGYKVVASMLRGDKVSVIKEDNGEIINFAPQIKLANEKKGLSGLIDSILEFFASMFHETDKSFIKAMNATYDKNKMSFNQLEAEDRKATNRTQPRTTAAVENDMDMDDSITPIRLG